MAQIKNYDKQQAIEQWENDPCGLHQVKGHDIGAREFYEEVDNDRYSEFPWMESACDFERFSGQTVLEIGFGIGTDLFRFAKAGSTISGIELVPKHVEITKNRFSLYDIDANLMLADAEDMPFADAVFDAVYTFGVIHHTPNADRAVDEIYRVLKPGGKAIIGVYHKHSAKHIFTIFVPYLLRLRFLRGESYRQRLSRIEHREHSNACPLVKLYSRRQLRKILNKFSSVQIDCFHIRPAYFGVVRTVLSSRWVQKLDYFGIFRNLLSDSSIQKWESRLGWFLIAKCIK